jgi:hypothetical protein
MVLSIIIMLYLIIRLLLSYSSVTNVISVFASTWNSRVASSFVLAANQSTLRRTEKIKRTILTIGGDVRETIQKIIKAMTEMQSLLLPYDPSISMSLNMTIHRLGRESHVIRRSVDKNGHSIDQAIHTS